MRGQKKGFFIYKNSTIISEPQAQTHPMHIPDTVEQAFKNVSPL